MSTISCGYRIYPRWFGGGHMVGPMNELAANAADKMGRHVDRIDVTEYGTDHRGSYIDFRVTYTSTDILREAGW
jgi:hypothetical protein